MITEKELIKIGTIAKPHGIKGEMTASLDYDIDLAELQCIVVPVEGIFVPFFINGVRPKSTDNVILSIDGINDETEAKELCGNPYYALLSDVDIDNGIDEEGGYVSDFVGYDLFDGEDNFIGRITDFDDSTDNVLFHVTSADGKVILIPVAAELFEQIDSENHRVVMTLPEGLIASQETN